MKEKTLESLKIEAIDDLKQIITQAIYGNIYQYQIDNFIIDIMNIAKLSQISKEKIEE